MDVRLGTYSEACGEDGTYVRPILQQVAAGDHIKSRCRQPSLSERVRDQDILNETPFARNEHCDFTSFVASKRLCAHFEHCFDPHQGPASTSCPPASLQIASLLSTF